MKVSIVALSALLLGVAAGGTARAAEPPAVHIDSKAAVARAKAGKVTDAEKMAAVAYLLQHPAPPPAPPAPPPAPTVKYTAASGHPLVHINPREIEKLVGTVPPRACGATILFDDPGLADGTIIDTFYSSVGAVFSAVGAPAGTHVYTRSLRALSDSCEPAFANCARNAR